MALSGRALILDENAIGEAGIAALRDMLAKKVRIVLFIIVNNPEVPQELAEALCRKVPSEKLKLRRFDRHPKGRRTRKN
jgi:hypothetical protein